MAMLDLKDAYVNVDFDKINEVWNNKISKDEDVIHNKN